MKPIIAVHNAVTGVTIQREMNDDEYASYLEQQAQATEQSPLPSNESL